MSLSPRDRTLTLVGILMALFLGALDQTIVATALPRMVEDLGGLDRYAWVATSYLLASTVLVPIYGKLADMYSRKSIEIFAVVTFLAGSFLAGLSGEFGDLPLLGDGMSQLIIFRALQGIGGAGLFSMAFIVIADLFPPNVRGKYQGLVGAVFGVASVLGPWIGGVLTDHGGAIIPGVDGWRWVFYVNLPFGAIALWFLLRRMPPLLPMGERKPLDKLSAVLLVLGLVPIVLGLQLDKNLYPWTGAVTLGMLAFGLAAMVAFVLRSIHSRNPILDMTLFRNRVFATSNAALFFLGAAFLSMMIFLPLFMVNVVGVSATKAGVSLIPLSLGLVFGSIVSGQLVSRFGRYRMLMLVGNAILLVAMYLFANMTPDIPYWQVTVYMIIGGLGVGPSMPLYTLAIQNAVDMRKIGQATSTSQFFRQIGGTVGAAVMGSVLAVGLSTGFAAMQAPLGQAPAGGGGDAFSTQGLEQIGRQVEVAFDTQYEAIATAVRAGDEAQLQLVLSESPMPELAQRALMATAGTAMAAGPDAQDAFLATVQAQFQREAKVVAEEVTGNVKRVFSDAITRIYRDLIWVVILGTVVTLFIPVLTLRSSNEMPTAAVAE